MGQPVVHFEIIGNDPAKLRSYYGRLFGWEFDTSGPVPTEVSEPDNYGFVDGGTAGGINGGVGGGEGYDARVVFYVSVPNVEAALATAVSLGGKRRMGPTRVPGKDLVVAQFTDPEGHLIGLASVS